MTIPYECTRTVLQTRQFLQNLASIPRVPRVVREEARAFLRHYPCLADIELAHKAPPDWFGPVPPFSRMHAKTAIAELGLDQLGPEVEGQKAP